MDVEIGDLILAITLAMVWGGLLLWNHWKKRTIKTTQCPHGTKIDGQITAYGVTIQAKVPVKRGTTSYCHDCLGKMAIRCATCGRPIFIGQHIALAVATEGREMPEYAVRYEVEGPGVYIACIRPSCADMGEFDAQGRWAVPGKVFRFHSATEVAISAFRHGATAVIIER